MKRKPEEELEEVRPRKRARHQDFFEKLQRRQRLRTTTITVSNEAVEKTCRTRDQHADFEYRKARQIARSDELFSTEHGTVMGFGSNDCYALGLRIADSESLSSEDAENVPPEAEKAPNNRMLPTTVPKVNRVRTISTGGMHTVALTVDGDVYVDEGSIYGDESEPQKVPFMRNVIQVKAGESSTLFLNAKGQVFMCGTMRSSKGDHFYYPADGISCQGINSIPVLIPMPGNQMAVRIETRDGSNFAAVLLKDGRIATFGTLAFIVLLLQICSGISHLIIYWIGFAEGGGLARPVDVTEPDSDLTEAEAMSKFLTPRCVHFPYQSKKVLSMACGAHHLLVLARDRGNGSTTLYSSGHNFFGQLGFPADDDFKTVHKLTEVKHGVGLIAAGPYHSYAVDEDGYRMFATGRNDSGQLGLGPSVESRFGFEQISFPRPVLITKIAAGTSHGMALDSQNTLYTWGYGTMGATGHPCDVDNNEEGDIFRPTPLVLGTRKKILDFGGGGQHSAVVLSENDHESE